MVTKAFDGRFVSGRGALCRMIGAVELTHGQREENEDGRGNEVLVVLVWGDEKMGV